MNQLAKYLGHLVQKLLSRPTDTHQSNCSTWTTNWSRR